MKKILFSLFLASSVAFAKDVVLVQGAMDMEVDYLVEQLKDPVKEQVAAWTFWKGSMGDKTVVVSRTEVGLTNVSASTAIGIERYSPTLIINQGTSGGHDPKLHTGDIVLGEKMINIGAMRTERKEADKPANYKDWIFFDVVQRLRDATGKKQENKYFVSDEKFMELAENLEYGNGKVVRGVIGTADQWNRELERINFLHEKFNTSVEEMETTASAQIAKAYDIPFIGVRILSNTDVHNEDFNPNTALWCQEYVASLIRKIK